MNVIIYTSQTGSTKRYAQMLGEALGIPIYNTKEDLPKEKDIIYLGWIRASKIQGYKMINKKYNIKIAIGVGMGPNDTKIELLRQKNKIPLEVPLYTLQGNIHPELLHGMDKIMMTIAIKGTIKGLSEKEELTLEDQAMLEAMTSHKDHVLIENLNSIIKNYKGGSL